MKTSYLRLFSLIAIFAMTLVSCSKDEAPTIDNNQQQNNNNNQNNAPEARFTLEQKDTGEAITEGKEIVFNAVNKSLYIKVKNKVNEELKTRLRVVSMTGTDGAKLRMCYGLCSNGVTAGALYPVGNAVIKVPAMGTTSGWDNCAQTQWDGSTTIEYLLEVLEVNDQGQPRTDVGSIKFKYVLKAN